MPRMLLSFYTETSGLSRSHHAPVRDLSNWPRIVQIAWHLTDQQGNTQQAVEAIIRPEGFFIPADAARVHGIATARAISQGQLLPQVLNQLLAALSQAVTFIGHNLAFDEKVRGAELLPGRYGYKWPRLDELHRHLFGRGMGAAHNALVDVEA